MELVIITKQELAVIIENAIEKSLQQFIEKKTEHENKKKYLTVKEVAYKLNVSELTIRNYIKRGTLKAKRIGNRILINNFDLENKLKEVKSLKYKR